MSPPRPCTGVSFEVETLGLLLSSVGILLLTGVELAPNYTQIIGMFLGVLFFFFLIWFMGDPDRVMKWRIPIAIAAIAIFGLNLLIGQSLYGAKNWIILGPVSIQPSEFVKIAFIFTGASTLERLQTARNLGGFLIFSGLCMGALFLMKDLGAACIFFVTFLIIAFMRSGSIRTIILILGGAVLAGLLVLQIMPHITDRFAAWRHVWEFAESSGYQQTHVLMYAASGGLFGTGLGNGYLKNIFAGDSDLVFGMLCEELGLLMALVVVLAIGLLILFARSDVTRSRSTFYSISACATAGLLVFQTCLNVFGATDVLPLTGVTLPFISAGGSSILAVWGILAFIKASDERTYAVSPPPAGSPWTARPAAERPAAAPPAGTGKTHATQSKEANLMKTTGWRSLVLYILGAGLLAGLIFFVVTFFLDGGSWAMRSNNQHLSQGSQLGGAGSITDPGWGGCGAQRGTASASMRTMQPPARPCCMW